MQNMIQFWIWRRFTCWQLHTCTHWHPYKIIHRLVVTDREAVSPACLRFHVITNHSDQLKPPPLFSPSKPETVMSTFFNSVTGSDVVYGRPYIYIVYLMITTTQSLLDLGEKGAGWVKLSPRRQPIRVTLFHLNTHPVNRVALCLSASMIPDCFQRYFGSAASTSSAIQRCAETHSNIFF